MALRLLASQTTRAITKRAFSSNAVSATASSLSVADVTVKLTFVDPSGARRQVPGYVGKRSARESIFVADSDDIHFSLF